MKENAHALRRRSLSLLVFAALFVLTLISIEAAAQDAVFRLDPQHTTINFTLGDVLHTVRGTFRLKEGTLHFATVSGKLTGEILVDAKSGESGNGMRDRKMHREVLESDRYPEIAFRPDHVEGTVASQGKSSVRVHGVFTIHGADHELTIPTEVETFPDHWTVTLHFTVPYAQWGMKNPSTLFLRVNESVDIDVTASGSVTRP
jgi:polyisoprenoid-binding protein YceI